jgi:hypothetical protein
MSDYSPTHPWYYLLSGTILRSRQIKAYAELHRYRTKSTVAISIFPNACLFSFPILSNQPKMKI